jgi:hypothetical protein
MNGIDTFLDINNAHLRVNSGNVQASTFVLDQINIVTSANTATTVNFNNVTKAFNAVSNIEVGTANLFVDTTTSKVGIGTDAPAYTLDVHGSANVGALTATTFSGSGAGLTALNAANITTGTLDAARVPDLDAAKITTGTLDAARVPNLDAAKITTGTLDAARVPDLDAAKITTGTLDAARVPDLDAAKITTGTLDAARVPVPTTFGGATFSGDVTVDTPTFHVDTTNNRVGVGTTNPATNLHLLGVGTGLGPRLRFETLNNGNSQYTTGGTEIGGIQFGADDLTWSTQHMSSEIVGIHDSPNYSGALGILSFRTSTSQGSNPTEKMRIKPNGNVGIGTTTPHAKLQVNGQEGALSASSASSFNTWANGGNYETHNNFAITGISIHASHDIVSGSYIASHRSNITASDERIKKDIVDLEDGPALETLRLLKPKRYKYKDVVRGGTDPVWGFIAQEVRETLSYATQLRQDSIPNIYEMVNISTDSSVITFTNFDTSTLESGTKVLKVFDESDTEHFITFTEVIDDNSLRIEEDLSKWTQLFVYGQRVDDFVFVQKDAIWTVATAALQEVDRQLQAEKEKVTTLETQLASVLTRLDALENA